MSDVVLDAWAWYEIVDGTPKGKALLAKYEGRIHTSVMALAEVGAKVWRKLGPDNAAEAMLGIEDASKAMHDVTAADARSAAAVHATLRRRAKDASLADALHLCTARRVGLPLVSDDPAFRGEADVSRD